MLKRTLTAFSICLLWCGLAFGQSLNVVNSTPFTGSAIGNGYTFSASGSQLFVQASTPLQFGAPFTVSWWYNSATLGNTIGTTTSVLGNFTNTLTAGFNFGYDKIVDPAFPFAFTAYPGGNFVPASACAQPNYSCVRAQWLNDGNWHHQCDILNSAGQASQTIDGILRDFNSRTANSSFVPSPTFWNFGPSTAMALSMRDVAVYNRALGPDECATINNRGVAGFSLNSGNAPASLSVGLVGNWNLGNCTGSLPSISCADSSGNAQTATTDAPPTVAVTAPTNGATGITGTITVSGTCTDGVAVSKVSFAVDGTTFATVAAPGPYTTTFNTTLVPDSGNPHTASATCTNVGGQTATASNSFSTNNGPVGAATYYIDVAGHNSASDSNNGTSPTSCGANCGPWLTPLHNVRAGDTINVAKGNYSDSTGQSFTVKQWGQVFSAPNSAGVYFAKLICNSSFLQDCAVTTAAGGSSILSPDQSNWQVQGFFATNTESFGTCFSANPNAATVPHFLLFVGNYAKGCDAGTGLQDYSASIGNLYYGNATSSGVTGNSCFSAISVASPTNSNVGDTGTHGFIGGNFFINNAAHYGCADGEAVILDSWGGSHYTAQWDVEQNLFIGTGSAAFEYFSGVASGSAPFVFFNSNTTWGNTLALGVGSPYEVFWGDATSCCVSLTNDVIVATAETVCKNETQTCPPATAASVYAIGSFANTGHTTITTTYFYNTAAAQYLQSSGTAPTQSGNTNADPGFAAPAQVTSAPNCATAATPIACVAAITANFVPSGGAAALGYQPPGLCNTNALYPVWLYHSVPNGYLTKPCAAG